jgi:hypothetical protein
MVGIVRIVRVIHRHDIRQHRWLHVIIVIGRNAHKLRTFDEESRVTDKSQPDLI